MLRRVPWRCSTGCGVVFSSLQINDQVFQEAGEQMYLSQHPAGHGHPAARPVSVLLIQRERERERESCCTYYNRMNKVYIILCKCS